MGKTKDLYESRIEAIRLVNKTSITAGDGLIKKDFKGKDRWATSTTSRVFEFLEKCGIKTHFLKQDSPNSFLAIKCNMIPLEVVIRRKVGEKSSYLKRNPDVSAGTVFQELVVEFFWKNDELHDPIVKIKDGFCFIHDPKEPISDSSCLGKIEPLCSGAEISRMTKTAKLVFSCLEEALAINKITLEDLKIEFGRIAYGSDKRGKIILADVIDNDSWRIKLDERDLSKQLFRDRKDDRIVRSAYRIVAKICEYLPQLAGEIKKKLRKKKADK
ncbi:MAG: phosphoribosylaminoimidazolesuccinocarboxamide synthase [Minisyncoccia bacterium]